MTDKQRVLWIDDCKPVPYGWEVARTYDEAIRMVRENAYDAVYLDHDLGEERTGFDLLRQLIAEGLVPPYVQCISLNFHGKAAIEALYQDYLAGRLPALSGERG